MIKLEIGDIIKNYGNAYKIVDIGIKVLTIQNLASGEVLSGLPIDMTIDNIKNGTYAYTPRHTKLLKVLNEI